MEMNRRKRTPFDQRISVPVNNKRVENFLRTVEFRYPEWIPCVVSIMPATWVKYEKEVEKIALEHPKFFPHYKKGDFKKIELSRAYQKGRWKDVWGIAWENIEEGLDSIPVEKEAPLRNWENLKNYKAPHPLLFDWFGEKIDWEERKKELEEAKKEGNLASGGLAHGFMYMRLYYLRGFTNLMMDIASEETRLNEIIEMLLNYNLKLVDKWIEIGAEIIYFGDDLGLQKSLPISPSAWRRYLKPCYAKIFGTCRDRGVYVYLHSDGHILEIIKDLVECGVNIINPQIRANGLEGLEKVAKGKICLHLDLDRQSFPFASRQEIKNHIWKAVKRLGLKKGGLMLHAECGPDVPLENIETICQVFEKVGGGPSM